MFIKDFHRIVDANAKVRVYDKYGYVGTFDAIDLRKHFEDHRYIIEIGAYALDVIDITID